MIDTEGDAHSDNWVNITKCWRITVSGKISLDTEAPDFSLNDYSGQRINLSDFRDEQHVVLVFNRGYK